MEDVVAHRLPLDLSALLRRQRIVERRRHHLLQPVLLHEPLDPPPKVALLLGEHLLVGEDSRAARADAWWRSWARWCAVHEADVLGPRRR